MYIFKANFGLLYLNKMSNTTDQSPLLPVASSATSTSHPTTPWYIWLVRLIVFAITGSTAVRATSWIIHHVFKMEGTFHSAPFFPYKLTFIVLTLPVYTILILIFGTIAWQRKYFSHIAWNCWAWMLPSPVKRRIQNMKICG